VIGPKTLKQERDHDRYIRNRDAKIADSAARYAADPDAHNARCGRWRAKNVEKLREIRRAYKKRKRSAEALAALDASRKTTKTQSRASALVALAEAKATQAMYGIQRVGYQERR
jgi:hypothetical protein